MSTKKYLSPAEWQKNIAALQEIVTLAVPGVAVVPMNENEEEVELGLLWDGAKRSPKDAKAWNERLAFAIDVVDRFNERFARAKEEKRNEIHI